MASRPCFGQITITSHQFNVGLISPSTLFHTTLHNPGQNARFWVEGTILDSRNEPVVSFVSQAQEIRTGTWPFSAQDFIMKTFAYGTSEAGRSAQLFQRLPGGSYRTCLTVKCSTEGDDRTCEGLEVDDILSIDLVHPWNLDTIDETRPTLTWAISSGGSPLINARLVLTSLPQGRKPAHAVASERPLFMVPEVKPGPVQYPIAIADLERGKCYAWQVEQVDGSRVKERSEPWGFCVRRSTVPKPEKFVRINSVDPGSVYHVVDGRIYFRYDEPYTSGSLTCYVQRVHALDRSVSPAVDRPTGSANTVTGASPRSIGLNLYEFDLTDHRLKPGKYTLVVKNEKGREYHLRFDLAQ